MPALSHMHCQSTMATMTDTTMDPFVLPTLSKCNLRLSPYSVVAANKDESAATA